MIIQVHHLCNLCGIDNDELLEFPNFDDVFQLYEKQWQERSDATIVIALNELTVTIFSITAIWLHPSFSYLVLIKFGINNARVLWKVLLD